MNYPQYVAPGWQIGSGPVESACGTVVGDRLCGSGMRWAPFATNAISHLRALYLSQRHQWQTFGKAYPN